MAGFLSKDPDKKLPRSVRHRRMIDKVFGRRHQYTQLYELLQPAQAAGDRQALTSRDRPLLWLHLTDRTAGVAQLLAAANALT